MAGLELLVGGWFASPVIRRVVDKAQKYLGANCELQKGTQDKVEALTRTLVLAQAMVREVEKRVIINNPDIGIWLRMLKETVYEAEDVLDNMETKSIKEKVQGKNKVSKLVSSSLSVVSSMLSPDDINKSLKKVVDQLNKLSTDIPKILNLVNMNEKYESDNREVTYIRETISKPLEEVGLYGRQNELNLILDMILRAESESSKNKGQNDKHYHSLLVIPIVGMGGVGKTALAQAVYNNPEVEQTFAPKAWISVSNGLDVVLVMRKIFQSLSGYSFKIPASLEFISRRITQIIRGVKYLIVLDDLFTYQWDVIYTTLSHCAPGSVVLITTQNQVFANRIGTFGPVALRALDLDVFQELFERFAFGNQVMTEEKRITLKSIGNTIAENLRGLPLAAKIVGNILRTNLDEERWRRISNSEWWDIPEGRSQILSSIGLGYEQLDPCLRQCFAYCSVFPRNSLIEKDRLVHMWIAQNFIQSDANGVMRLEDIGKQWFDELVERSFFQHAGDNNSYVMHEIMHDLAVIVSSGECFYLGEGELEIPLGVRHLAVGTNNIEVIKGIEKHKNLRSFLYFGFGLVEGMYNAINDMLSNLDSIRVLDLSYMWMEKEREPPRAIWNLQHLRFLDLSSTGIKVLTHSSSIDLYHLQCLYIKKCEFRELPRGINKLINLRHLFAGNETISKISGIGQLTNLQELSLFNVGKKEGHRITELRNLREIRGTLTIRDFSHIKNKDEAMLANLVNKKHLDSICFEASYKRETNVDMEVLEELQPHKDIKELRISHYAGSVFPNWIIQIADFQNLNTLYLISCDYVEVLPPLGELPSLKFLQIQRCYLVKCIDYHLYGEKQTVFPLLEELDLKELTNCEEWTDPGHRVYFPRLSKLTIANKTLREAPLHLFSSTLKELTISDCSSLISLENSIPHLSSLTRLELHSSLASVSFDPLNMPLLEDLNLENCSELKITGDIQSLIHLKCLRLVSSSKLFSTYSTKDQQKETGLQVHRNAGLRSLTHIEADHCLLHHEYHQILGSLPSLRVLKFSDITQFTNHQNLWFQEQTTLQEIHFSYCDFEHLPASLTLLSSLKKMALKACRELESLSDSMPPNLQELILDNFSRNLVQLCEANMGRDHQFISSIPVIHIDDHTRHRWGKIPNAHKIGSMEIWKPLSDAIREQRCDSCGKRFEPRDFVLRDYEKLPKITTSVQFLVFPFYVIFFHEFEIISFFLLFEARRPYISM